MYIALILRSCKPRIPIKKSILIKMLSKKIKKVNMSCEKKQPINKKSKKKKNIYKFFIFQLKFQDHIILKIIINFVNKIKSKPKLFILNNVYKHFN